MYGSAGCGKTKGSRVLSTRVDSRRLGPLSSNGDSTGLCRGLPKTSCRVALKVGDKPPANGEVDKKPFEAIVGLLNRTGGEDGGVIDVEGVFRT